MRLMMFWSIHEATTVSYRPGTPITIRDIGVGKEETHHVLVAREETSHSIRHNGRHVGQQVAIVSYHG
jgi:hypothetical protein